MLIVCPNCASSYRVEPSSLGGAGRSVRCVRCRTIWFARDPNVLPAITEGFRSEAGEFLASFAANPAPPSPADIPPPDAARPERAGETAEAESDGAEAPLMPEPQPAETSWAVSQLRSENDGWQSQVTFAPVDAPAIAPVEDEPADGPIEDEPVLVPIEGEPVLAPIEQGSAPLPANALGEDIETVAARRARETAGYRLSWPLPGLPTTIMTLIALNAVLIGWRADVVKIAPQTASLYAAIGLPVNLRGLAFARVQTTAEMRDGTPVLVVEGTIVSTVARTADVPRLRFAVRDRRGQEIYAWTALPSRSQLAPGETLAFSSRLASSPPDGHDVLVRFFSRRDLVAGLQ